MKPNCPNPYCVIPYPLSPKIKPIVRNGSMFRKSDSRYIQRFFCRKCGKYFSTATFDPRFGQKKRRVNYALNKLLCSGVSQRRAAKILKVNLKTVERKFRYLADQARESFPKTIQEHRKSKLNFIQFDDLETSIHTKCKPASVSLAVSPKDRKILGYSVAQMPAKGTLAEIAFKKYGFRPDHRPRSWVKLMHSLLPYFNPTKKLLSDQNPHYPKYVKHFFSDAKHETTKGGRGCIAGQGELKKLKFDPLFSLNHTCAMMRANMSRLFRRTWCTSKTIRGLEDHLAIYIHYHNTVLTRTSDA